ncbi:hypothetical protein Tco_1493664 [Tanacetum coccineum]
MIMVVPVEEVYVEALQVKYPIIDWEVYSKDIRKYWKIIRVGNHTEAYQTFDDISTDPTDDKERTLWVELKRLFEPDTDDILWKLQRENIKVWEDCWDKRFSSFVLVGLIKCNFYCLVEETTAAGI